MSDSAKGKYREKPKKTALLSPCQKQFCRAYVRHKDDHKGAILEVYNFKTTEGAMAYALELLRDPRIVTYIEYVRQEVETHIPNTMTFMVETLIAAIKCGLERKQAASVAKCIETLDKIRGTGRRRQSFSVAQYENLRDKLDVIYAAYADDEIGTDQLAVLVQSVKSAETESLVQEIEELKKEYAREKKVDKDG